VKTWWPAHNKKRRAIIAAPSADFWNFELLEFGPDGRFQPVFSFGDLAAQQELKRPEADPPLLNEIAEGDNVRSRPNRNRNQSDPTDDLVFHDTLRLSRALPVTRGGRYRGTPFDLLDAQGRQKVQLTLTVPGTAEFSFADNGLVSGAGIGGSGRPPKMVAAGSRGRAGRYALTRRGVSGGIGGSSQQLFVSHARLAKGSKPLAK
jgi:hypothetical protein